MKNKCSMVVLFVVLALFNTCLLGAAPISGVPEVIDASEQMSFSPLVFATALLCVVVVCSVCVSVVYYRKYKTLAALTGSETEFRNNLDAQLVFDDGFDYRLIETPSELNGAYSQQSEYAKDEITSLPVAKRARVPLHKRRPSGDTEPISHIKLVPEMKHARRRGSLPVSDLATTIEMQALGTNSVSMPQELEYLLRKIG